MTAAIAPPTTARAFTRRNGLSYGLTGMGLAFVALPLYVVLPHFYASEFGVPLAALGALLLGTRLFDAVMDPLLGRWVDRLYLRSHTTVLRWAAGAAFLLCAGFALLYLPPFDTTQSLLWWLGGCLVITYVGFSLLTLLHLAWAAQLGGSDAQRARLVAWREGMGLAGVMLASAAPALLGMGPTSLLLAFVLAVGWWTWSRSVTPAHVAVRGGGSTVTDAATQAQRPLLWLPLQRPAFRRLLAVFVVNGIASALPATLIRFFVHDVLAAPTAMEPLFLGSYFLCAALALPLWPWLVARIGLERTWLLGMLASVPAFCGAALLGSGDSMAFLAVCCISGAALGADLVVPSALLARLIADQGDNAQSEGAYFGWWNFANKLNLALAAGVALPALSLLGYAPGTQEPEALRAVGLAYGVLPCLLKLAAAALFFQLFLRRTP